MSDETILEEIRSRHKYALDQWGPIRKEAQIDMRFVSGDPWTEQDRRAREAAGRPCLSLDELSQYHNQTINDLRANPRGMKFSATGAGANDAGARFYQNKAREIEYRSTAAIAYITAAENMIQRSYGWVRIKTDWESEHSYNQDLWIEPVVNPDNVLPDPDAQWPDSRDLRYLFYLESRLKAEFTREFPDAAVKDFSLDHETLAPGWIHGDRVQIAEYWTKAKESAQLHLVQPAPRPNKPTPQPIGVFDDELQIALKKTGGALPAGWRVLRSQPRDRATVTQYLTNGIEILETHKWAGKHIPFVSCFGKVLYVDTGGGAQRQILSMTRLARDPQMLYCYYRTCEAELVGMTPKFPYFVYEGQLSPQELLNLQKSLHEPIAVIQVKPTVDGAGQGQVLGMPQRQPYEPPIVGLEAGAESARRAVQAAMGISPLPTQAQRQNQKSGTALRQIEASGQKGSFHYRDHYEGMIQRVGVILEDLLDKIIDTPRDVWTRESDDTAKKVRVNDPEVDDPIFTRGDYQVTVSTGPDFESERAAADDFVDTMVGNLQIVAGIAGPQKAAKLLANSVKLKQLGPIGDQIVELLDPPAPQGPDGKPVNPELQQATQENQQLKQQLQQAADAIKSKQVEKQAELQAQGAIKKMELDAQGDREMALQMMKNAATIAVAHIAAASKGLSLDAHATEEAQALGHESDQNALDRQHELNKVAVQHQAAQMAASQQHDQNLEAGDQAHAQSLEAGDVAHQQALAQGDASAQHAMDAQQQAADLAPDPSEAA